MFLTLFNSVGWAGTCIIIHCHAQVGIWRKLNVQFVIDLNELCDCGRRDDVSVYDC